MSTYSITWSYRNKATTESIEADSPGGAVAKLTRNVARRLDARRKSIAILKIEEPSTGLQASDDHRQRVLAHQQSVAAQLKQLAASARKPPRRVTR